MKLGEDGLYHYAESSPLKNNIKSAPLKRTEVGPEWAKAQWGEFGIEDKPYVEQPIKDVNAISRDETEISEITPETSKNDYSYIIIGLIVIIAMGIL
ncbi:hypothetical protein FE783_35575 [Paenibacillus mesophilus]|nr:hypothetical protein FE783_35575 [Paenibacillus mesophilus]